MKTCQIFILVLLAISFVGGMRSNFYARPAQPAHGFSGAVVDLVMLPLQILLLWKAGAFSELF